LVKQFTYRGLSQKELEEVPLEKLLKLFPARARRSLTRGINDGKRKLIEEIKVEGSELLVHLGPAISQSAYEVGSEVKTQFLDRNSIFERSFIEKNGKYYLDLYDGAKVILEGYGITSISGGDCCTYEDSKQFFSFRRDGECSGRMAHLIWMV